MGTRSRGDSILRNSSPLNTVINADDLSDTDLTFSRLRTAENHRSQSDGMEPLPSPLQNSEGFSTTGEPTPELCAYNEYGEWMEIEKMREPLKSSELTLLQTMRLLQKAYYREFREKMRDVIAPQLYPRQSPGHQNSGDSAVPTRISSWDFLPAPNSANISPCSMSDGTMNEKNHIRVHTGPPRVLEIGCGDGRWCFALKHDHPDWIVEGVDSYDQWTERLPGFELKDFMKPHAIQNPHDYFNRVHMAQEQAEFTARNINKLLGHPLPLSQNLYSFVRGMDIFDRVENYKLFLEDVRQIVQPDGVVEFIEIDPRLRKAHGIKHDRSKSDEHISGPEIGWTDKIVDRFVDPFDSELATTIPNWVQRIENRINATLRPIDGIPASQLKSWLEGSGFWDVQESVIALPIGGDSPQGSRLLQVMEERVWLENSIPKLLAELPSVDIRQINSGEYCINLHVVTGRKPKAPRPGDMLPDGTRMDVSEATYQAMAMSERKSSLWERFDLDNFQAQVNLKMRDLKLLAGVAGPALAKPE